MALLQIDASDGTPRLFGAPHSVKSALASALRQSPGPVTLLIHGFKYAPGHPSACPHGGLFAERSSSLNPKVISWPRHLHTAGLCIGFGWRARGRLGQVYARAAQAGQALATLIRLIRRIDPTRPVHVLCHSMGARVALTALPELPAGSLSSLLMLAAAEYRSVAQSHLASPAGRNAHVWHVTSGENDLYDFLFERFIAPPQRGDVALGPCALPGLTPILLDDNATLTQLAHLGYRIAPPARRFCHWSPYLRGGVFGLYSALIRGDLCGERLRMHLPAPEHRRWSRLLARLPATAPLPLPQDASV